MMLPFGVTSFFDVQIQTMMTKNVLLYLGNVINY